MCACGSWVSIDLLRDYCFLILLEYAQPKAWRSTVETMIRRTMRAMILLDKDMLDYNEKDTRQCAELHGRIV